MDKRPEQTLHQRGHMHGKQAHKKCSASLVMRDMQIKTTIRYITTYTLIWLKLKRLTIPSVGQDVEQLELSYIV